MFQVFAKDEEVGYTVAELAEDLRKAASEGYGSRRLLIGPLTSVYLKTDYPITLGGPVHGIEINDNYEEDIAWLYPEEPE